MRRPLVLFVASATALVGLVLLGIAFVGIGVRTLQASQDGTSACLRAYADDLDGSHVRYTVFPPQSICTFDVDGESQETVVASASSLGATLGAVLALGGVAVCVGVLLEPRLRSRPAA